MKKRVMKISTFVMAVIVLVMTFSNKAYAYLGMTHLEGAIFEKFTGKKFDEYGAMIIHPGEYDMDLLDLSTAAEHNYIMGYYEKEVDDLLVGDEYEKASDDFFASKGSSLQLIEAESGWNDSLIEKYRKSPKDWEAPYNDGKAARAQNDKAGKKVKGTKTSESGVKMNTTTYNGVDYSKEFNAQDYYDNYVDLQQAIGKNGMKLLEHYVKYGKNEGRKAMR